VRWNRGKDATMADSRTRMLIRSGTASVLIALAAAPLAAAPQHVVVVLDDSGSMCEPLGSASGVTKMEAAKEALITVLRDLPADASLGVVVLNRGPGDPAWIVPLGRHDRSSVAAAVQEIQPAGGTPLGEFMKVGTDALLELRQKEHYGRYRLLIVTDGEATDRDLVETYLPDILSRGITVDVIGVDMQADHSLATRVHAYRRADDPPSLARAISESLAESVPDQQAVGASDFELLAGLPEEVAARCLKVLAESGNQPIGQLPGGAPRPELPPPSGGASGVVRAVGLGAGLFCVIVLMFIVGVAAVTFRLTRRS